MFKWFKKFFKKKKKEITTLSKLPQVKSLPLKPNLEQYYCNLHSDYKAIKPPTNNCNICWEYYSQRCKHKFG